MHSCLSMPICSASKSSQKRADSHQIWQDTPLPADIVLIILVRPRWSCNRHRQSLNPFSPAKRHWRSGIEMCQGKPNTLQRHILSTARIKELLDLDSPAGQISPLSAAGFEKYDMTRTLEPLALREKEVTPKANGVKDNLGVFERNVFVLRRRSWIAMYM